MEFFGRPPDSPSSLALFSGAFHPPTRAHMAIAEAALRHADEVVFVLPRVFPHKEWHGAPFDQRLKWVRAAAAHQPRFSVAASETGLFIDIARECREAVGGGPKLYVLLGRDAAERIVHWDYGRPGAFRDQLRVFELLVAARHGQYAPPPELDRWIHTLDVEEDLDHISSSEVRRRIAAGEPWDHLVPPAVVPLVAAHFSQTAG
jgi:nicotinate-nucleotide adenylyltransferase